MGEILNVKRGKDEKIIVNLELNKKEYDWLKGNLDYMCIFSEKNLEYETRLVQRGKRESTKYFLLPKEFRKNIYPQNSVKTTRIETKNRYIYLFSINKYILGLKSNN
jgi:hypothetical protein